MAHPRMISPLEESTLNYIETFIPLANISLQDLRAPTSIIVSKFYHEYLEQLGVDTSNLHKMQGNQATAVTHADMFSEAITTTNVYQGINYFCKYIGINDFALSDLTNPTPKRTLSHFHAHMLFMAYCDDKICDLQPELMRVNGLQNTRNELLSKIEVMKNEINKNATERVKRREDICKIEKLIEKEKNDMEELMKERETDRVAVDAIKKSMEEALAKEKELIRIISDTQDEVERLKGMIVTSPGKLEANKNELIKERDKCSECLQSFKTQVEERQKMKHQLQKKQEEQIIKQEKLKELMENYNLIKKNMQTDKINTSKYDKLVEESEEQKNITAKWQSEKKKIEEAVNALKIREQKQEAEKQELLKRAETELDDVVSSEKEQKKYQAHLRQQIDQLQEEAQALDNECRIFVKEYYSQDEEVRKLVDKLAEDIAELQEQMRFHVPNKKADIL